MQVPSPQLLRVFLCHSSGDKPIVRDLYQKLSAEGWIDVWLDEEKLFPGMDWNLEIEKAVEATDVIIVCLSRNSVTREGYVQRELKYALDIALEKPEGTIFVIPLRLEDCEPPRRLRGWQYADYFPEGQRARAYHRMLESLKVRARHLNLNAPTYEKIPTSGQAPSTLSPIPDLEPDERILTWRAEPSPVLSPGKKWKRIPIWTYGRLMVIFLLVSGFFGPWFEIVGCSSAPPDDPSSEPVVVMGKDAYSEFISSMDLRLIIPLVVGALLVLTLARVIPWKYRNYAGIVRLERLAAGLAPIVMSVEQFSGTFILFGSAKILWGFWVSIIGAYLAPIILLVEKRSTMQRGQKWPRWAWLLGISIIFAFMVPWVIRLLLMLLSLLSSS